MGRQLHHDIDFEIRFYEGILEKRRDFLQALIALGDLYTRKGQYEEGLVIDERLSRLRPEDPVILYNLACSYSLTSRVDEAYETIKRAIACGYDDFAHLCRDSDLTNLLADKRFKHYLKKAASSRQKASAADQVP